MLHVLAVVAVAEPRFFLSAPARPAPGLAEARVGFPRGTPARPAYEYLYLSYL